MELEQKQVALMREGLIFDPKTGETMETKAIPEYGMRDLLIMWTYNPENKGKCHFCPYNTGKEYWRDELPCGQYHCWVTCATKGVTL